jgi:hypothetical protein
LSHAYELLKVPDERKRRRLAARVASGELSLVKLREKIEGRPVRPRLDGEATDAGAGEARRTGADDHEAAATEGWTGRSRGGPIGDDSLVQARHQLADAVEELVGVLRSPHVMASIPDVDRANLAKYLTIAKLKLENAIAMVRSGQTD